jgi:hypothetical protein
VVVPGGCEVELGVFDELETEDVELVVVVAPEVCAVDVLVVTEYDGAEVVLIVKLDDWDRLGVATPAPR